jgi:hypothetical protein
VCVQLLGLFGGDQADLDEVEGADEAVGDAEATGADDGVAQRHSPLVLDQDERRRRVVRDLLEHVPGVLVGEHLDAIGGRVGTRLGAGHEAFLALDAEPDQRADLAAQLDCLLLRQVAEVLDLDLAGGVLVDGQRVDDAYGVALAQPLELAMISPWNSGCSKPSTIS